MTSKKSYVLDVVPFPKPRMTRSDRWKKRKCVLQYFEFCDRIRLRSKEINFDLGDCISCEFVMPMPPSWSEKKKVKMDGKPHQQRPDLDNLLKAMKDALLEEDCTVWKYEDITKVWGRTGKIIIKEKQCDTQSLH